MISNNYNVKSSIFSGLNIIGIGMKYSKVYIDSIGYELAPHVVTSLEIEQQMELFYDKFNFKQGQLEILTGIVERRFWDPVHTMHQEATKAAVKSIEKSGISPQDIEMLIYGGVCRDNFEPATAFAVADNLGLKSDAQIFDVSNACVGVLTGIVQIANAIELGQIEAGMVVSCESARQIIESTINNINSKMDIDYYKKAVATLTGGAGAVAVLLTSESFQSRSERRHKLTGGVIKCAPKHHELCKWGHNKPGMPTHAPVIMETDAQNVLKYGIELSIKSYKAFNKELNRAQAPDKIICHQVGAMHRATILDSLQMPKERDFSTFRYLGNMGTVSLPITCEIASEYDFLNENDFVGLFGIGSGLNCIMLGVQW